MGVAHAEHLVHQNDVGFQNGGDGEAQLGLHAAGVGAHRLFDELLQLGKGDDLVNLGVNILLSEAQQEAGQVDILPAGELGLEPDAQGQQGDRVAVEVHKALVRLKDSRQNPQQGGFSA